MLRQSLRSASKSSSAVTLRRPCPGCQVCVHSSRTFASNALSTARCAPLQSAMALLTMRCRAPSQLALMIWDSSPIVGVSSKSAVLSSCASVRITVRAGFHDFRVLAL